MKKEDIEFWAEEVLAEGQALQKEVCDNIVNQPRYPLNPSRYPGRHKVVADVSGVLTGNRGFSHVKDDNEPQIEIGLVRPFGRGECSVFEPICAVDDYEWSMHPDLRQKVVEAVWQVIDDYMHARYQSCPPGYPLGQFLASEDGNALEDGSNWDTGAQ